MFVRRSSFLRNLKRFNGIVLLNMAGLAIGLAGVIFIALWVNHELSYDRFHENSDRIYRMESLLNWTGDPFVWQVTPAPLAQNIVKDYPDVELAVRMKKGYSPLIKSGEEVFNAENFYFASPGLFKLFSFNLIYGNPGSVLAEPYSILLSEKKALKLFGTTNILGKEIIYDNEHLMTVSGVFEDIPSNSHIKLDYIVPFSFLVEDNRKLDSWTRYNFYTYILLKEGVDAGEFNKKIKTYLSRKAEKDAGELLLNPLRRIHLYRDPGFESQIYPSAGKGPISTVILFSIIGVALLLIACINFINLSTAVSATRAKEIGVRKVAGASRENLVYKLFGESFTQAIISMTVALVIVLLLFPVFNNITGLDMSAGDMIKPVNILAVIAITTITAILSGIYPAIVLSSFKPVKVLKSKLDGRAKNGVGLRKILVLFQFTLSVLFIFCVILMNRQTSFMRNYDPGFDKENTMVVYPGSDSDDAEIIAGEIKKMPGVANVAIGNNVPVNMGGWQVLRDWDGNDENKELKFHLIQVDDNYIDLLGFKMAQGRQFNKGQQNNEVIINESAVKMMGMNSPLGKNIYLDGLEYEIIGVLKDFHFRKLKEEVKPVFIYKPDRWWGRKIFVKLAPGSGHDIVDRIAGVVDEFNPDYPANFIFLDEEMDNYYQDESRLNKLLNIATLISIIISSIGLFSLTAFATRSKQREIGIRKVHGASPPGIIFMLQKQFGYLIVISSLIAFPLAYYVISRWLQTYAYHITVKVQYFILTFILVSMVAALTILFHSLRSANLNPADTLREE
ncbi:MAG: ABC transporter permease [Bacteroidales bacterium]|nr:ABC transporter permease [Bacteroidales bacterium]